jgi:hypothetical protein
LLGKVNFCDGEVLLRRALHGQSDVMCCLSRKGMVVIGLSM